MKLFGQLIRTVVNTATLPVAVVKDVFTLGNFGEQPFTVQQLKKLQR